MNTPQANNAAPAAAPTAPADNGTGVTIGSFEERSASVFGNESSQAVGETASPTAEQPADSSSASPAASADDLARARRERLAKAAADMRASVDARQQKKQNEEIHQRLAATEKERDDARRMAEQRIDVTTLTEAQFFEHAAKAKVTPQRLAQWLKEQQEHPELAATRAVDSALDPKLAPLRKELDETKAQLQAFLDAQQRGAVEREEHEAYQEFATFTAQNATTSPYSAAFLRTHGSDQFKKLAISAAASVPPGAGAQAVLDHIEENLSMLAPIYAPSGASAKPSIPQPNPAAAKAMTTVSNTLAQTRASVVDEDADWASLPFEERSARVFGS